MPEALSDQNEALSDSGTHRASRVATPPREQLKVLDNFQDWHKIGAARKATNSYDVGLVQTHLTFVMKYLSLHSERFYGTSLAGNQPFTRSERFFREGYVSYPIPPQIINLK